MNDMECPYCGADQEVCHDDGHGYEEGKNHKHRCSKCKKNFVFQTTISFYYEPEKADCLNGADHQLKMSSTYPREYSKMRVVIATLSVSRLRKNLRRQESSLKQPNRAKTEMSDYSAQFARVLHSVAVNTDLACRFVLAELHRKAAWYQINNRNN